MKSSQLRIGEMSVAVARKPIRNLYVSVHPPDGDVRVAAPRALSYAEMQAAVLRKLVWIARKRAVILRRASETPRLRVSLASWHVKRMKTRWGSCNTRARRMWVNLELAKKPIEYLDYLVLHELTHLIVRAHDARFYAVMDPHLPGWRAIRRALNAAPIGA